MSIDELLGKISEFILNPIIILFFTVALLVFFWGIFQFVSKTDDQQARATGKRNMIWGIVGMFIMFAVFGIIRIILNTFGIDDVNDDFIFRNQ